MSQTLEPITVTATEANRRFSALLREVAAGRTVLITSRGQVVARLGPDEVQADPAVDDMMAGRRRAWAALEAFWAELDAREDRPEYTWSRDELYDEIT